MTIDFVRTTHGDHQTVLLGEHLGRMLTAGDVVALDGPLGAGKTTFARGIAAGMGIEPAAVHSPTFVVVNEYGAPAGRPDLIHVDAYRLGGADELETLGWDQLMEGGRPRGVLVVEWAERLAGALPPPDEILRARLEPIDEAAREISFAAPNAWGSRPGFREFTGRRPTTCPVTGAPVPPESPTYPFASERAKMADLHRWFVGDYAIRRSITERDLEED